MKTYEKEITHTHTVTCMKCVKCGYEIRVYPDMLCHWVEIDNENYCKKCQEKHKN